MVSYPLSWSNCRSAFGPISTPGLALMQAGCRAGGCITLHLAIFRRGGTWVRPCCTTTSLCRHFETRSPPQVSSAGRRLAIRVPARGMQPPLWDRHRNNKHEPPCPTSTRPVLPRVSAQDLSQTAAVVWPVVPAVESPDFVWRSLSSLRCTHTPLAIAAVPPAASTHANLPV